MWVQTLAKPRVKSQRDVRAGILLALQAESAYLVALHRMNARRAALAAADMQPTGGKLDLVPLQVADFRGA